MGKRESTYDVVTPVNSDWLRGVTSSGDSVKFLITAIETLLNNELSFLSSSGWSAVSGWTYASTSSVNVASGAASIYSVGDYVRFQNNDSGTYLYNKIKTVADTLLTLNTANVPNATLSDCYYSKARSPLGYPYNNLVGASAFLSSTLGTTVDATDTKVALNGESYDTHSRFADGKFTVPVTGYYDVYGQVTYGALPADKLCAAKIYKNGAAVKVGYANNGGDTVRTSAAAFDTLYLTAADYIELYYYQNSGATTPDVVGDASGVYTYLTVKLVSEV